ncbi:MAG: hypothetical protein QW520_08955, partial [Methanomassiliicoccales archaeon]
NVYLVSIIARYVGLAQFYDDEGRLLRANHSMKLYTIYAVKLDNLVEFEDLNHNGLLRYLRSYNEQENAFSNYVSFEPIYKVASLKTAWNASEITFEEDERGRHWDFDLTASDLPYQAVREGANEQAGDGVLNQIKLSFHLDVSVVHVNNASLPQWHVTVRQGPLGATWFSGLQRMENVQVSGDMRVYQVKWDKEIIGWDFEENNSNPMLLMEFETIFGNYIPPMANAVLNQNQYRLMLMATNQLGYMEANSDVGQLRLNQSTGGLPNAKPLASPRLSFGGDWSKVGRLEWVTGIEVDGYPREAKAQVMAAHRFTVMALNGLAFDAFVALCGITYPGGNAIVHDPTYAVETLVNLGPAATDDGVSAPFPLWALMMLGVLGGAVLIAVVAMALHRGAVSRGKTDHYERPLQEDKGDWNEYFEKK